YKDPSKWYKMSAMNIAGVRYFSCDRAINECINKKI
ncbi:MAG: glycogen/starch/alpha-glucan phosphorylase, partial [Oscillospiraceae bacterium]|nr:glycogen/starch/alpha-glucan phosphorylase [Oscillospiraceae bacterium]